MLLIFCFIRTTQRNGYGDNVFDVSDCRPIFVKSMTSRIYIYALFYWRVNPFPSNSTPSECNHFINDRRYYSTLNIYKRKGIIDKKPIVVKILNNQIIFDFRRLHLKSIEMLWSILLPSEIQSLDYCAVFKLKIQKFRQRKGFFSPSSIMKKKREHLQLFIRCVLLVWHNSRRNWIKTTILKHLWKYMNKSPTKLRRRKNPYQK